MEERRQEPRQPFSLAATVRVDETELRAKSLDLSSAGLSLKAYWSLPPGTLCRVELQCQGSGQPPSVIRAQVQVLHSAAVEGGFRVGMKFQQMDEASQALLSELLAQG